MSKSKHRLVSINKFSAKLRYLYSAVSNSIKTVQYIKKVITINAVTVHLFFYLTLKHESNRKVHVTGKVKVLFFCLSKYALDGGITPRFHYNTSNGF